MAAFEGFIAPVMEDTRISRLTRCNEIVQALIHNGASLEGGSSLFGNHLILESFTGNEDTVRLLLGKGADGFPSNSVLGCRPRTSCRNNKLLLGNGANVNSSASTIGTSSQVALSRGDKSTAQILRKYGANAIPRMRNRPCRYPWP